ncbi:MAG: GMP synthase (glutamine-hydrolyzing), partial [Oscillospiraceae bacterium]|nr:GMP synthase (glutamine-hydrolyzing) [Oscillospiraceae bacterium]
KIIGEEFIRVFEEEARKLNNVEFLAQGTIYPDVIESGKNGKDVIKSHHNVGGLPEDVDFKGIVEPLRALYKKEVRELGRQLGLPSTLVDRQPFPGPGLSIRCIGEVTKVKLDILREVDAIYRAELDSSGIIADQYFAALLESRSVGVANGKRAYGYIIALRAVSTVDFMTAKYVHIPHEILARISEKITNEVPEISRVVYDITNKPPGTVEWE